MPDHLLTPEGRSLAYNRIPGRGPGVVFLGGLRSDMTGTKALYLQDWAETQGRAFLRFDYSGHGQSSGTFEEGAIGDWLEDARHVIDRLTEGPQILVGSSMGGWIALLLARSMPERVAALVTIAAAPDFTEDDMWAGMSDAERELLLARGYVEQPSDYDGPYRISRRFIEDGRDHLVLRSPLPLPFPVRLLHGTGDETVPWERGMRVLEHASGEDIRLTLVKDADHRFSTPACLDLIAATLGEVLG